MTTIEISSLDLGYTIDTYGMFNGESIEECESEYYSDTYGLTEDEWRNFGFNYDHPAIVKSLAKSSIQLLHENLVQHGDGTIINIELVKTRSPQFYNYTTDSYTALWTVDTEKLEAYIKANQGDYNNFERDNWSSVYSSHGTEYFKQEDYVVASLDYYTRNTYDIEDYVMSMFEQESEAYYENMSPDEESQKLIDSKVGK